MSRACAVSINLSFSYSRFYEKLYIIAGKEDVLQVQFKWECTKTSLNNHIYAVTVIVRSDRKKRKWNETNRSGISLRCIARSWIGHKSLSAGNEEQTAWGQTPIKAVRALCPEPRNWPQSRPRSFSRAGSDVVGFSFTVQGKCVFCVSVLHIDSTMVKCGQRLKADRSCVGTRSKLHCEVFEEA